ncbi:MAG: DUF2089 domain-containing protein [Anaerolineales bacterium]
MNQLLTICPVCSERLTATRMHCRNCDTTIEGHFELGRIGRLSQDQLSFVETFIRCEGKLSRMEKEIGLSYPTLRSRLNEVIKAMGFEVGPEDPELTDEERHKILDDLATGKLSSEEAMRLLEGE